MSPNNDTTALYTHSKLIEHSNDTPYLTFGSSVVCDSNDALNVLRFLLVGILNGVNRI